MNTYYFYNDVADYTFIISVGDIDWQIRCRWNSRTEAWYADLLTADDVIIANAQKISLNNTLFETVLSPDKYPGILFILSTGEATAITRDNLATAARLIYVSQAEYEAAVDISSIPPDFVMTTDG